jgi:carboxypeptidase C (cathepsin A)
MSCRSRFVSVVLLLFVLGFLDLSAAENSAKGPENSAGNQSDQKAAVAGSGPDENLSITNHTLNLAGGGLLNYTATAGCLRLKDESGKPRADIFFVAYIADGQKGVRPITFVFNGGPGASSVWLHMGVAGPVRVTMGGGSASFSPRFQPEQNSYSWLPWTDLVFIDPVGTGFSRAIPAENAKQFFNTQEDVHAIGDFIQLYTSRFGRWLSPKCLAGESYGGMRAAGLLEYLYESYGMEIDGLILISPALDLHTIQPGSANDLPYVLFLPSYTAAAWYHKKIAPEYQTSLPDALSEAERWGVEEYLPALARGGQLSARDKDLIASRLAGFTGLPESYILNRNLRISRPDFTSELLRSEGLALGFLDGRTVRSGRGGSFLNDPGMAATVGPYTETANEYLRDELKFRPGIPYRFFSEEANTGWNWGPAFSGYSDVVGSIRKTLNRGRRLKILVTAGYFDLDVPYFATSYVMSHLAADPELVGNIRVKFFPGGHMFYTSNDTLEEFAGETMRFFKGLTAEPAKSSAGEGQS